MVAPLRYAANCDLSDPKTVAIGYNLSDCASYQLSGLPTGTKGLVWLGSYTLTTAVKNMVNACIGQPNLWGFYIADEPDPASVSAANLKAISDYCHTTCPGCKTFMVPVDSGDGRTPNYAPSAIYATAAGMDYFGIDVYPVRTDTPDSDIEATIQRYVANAQSAGGFPLAKLVPVYQCAGGDGLLILPTVSQMTRMFTTWDSVIPNPVFEYTYEWGLNSGETQALSNASAAMQTLFTNRFAGAPPADTQAPTVPAGLTGNSPSSTSVSLTWTASTDNVGVTGYKVYRNGALVSAVTTTTFTGNGLTPSTAYSFQVSAIDAAGNESAKTTAVNVTTQATGGSVEAYFTGSTAPAPSLGAVNDVYAQVTNTVTQGAPTYTQGAPVVTVPAPVITVPAPTVTTTTKFWKKTSTGWVAQ